MFFSKTASSVRWANLEIQLPQVAQKNKRISTVNISIRIKLITIEIIKKYKPFLKVFYFDWSDWKCMKVTMNIWPDPLKVFQIFCQIFMLIIICSMLKNQKNSYNNV